jgi:hypothetical protein
MYGRIKLKTLRVGPIVLLGTASNAQVLVDNDTNPGVSTDSTRQRWQRTFLPFNCKIQRGDCNEGAELETHSGKPTDLPD